MLCFPAQFSKPDRAQLLTHSALRAAGPSLQPTAEFLQDSGLQMNRVSFSVDHEGEKLEEHCSVEPEGLQESASDRVECGREPRALSPRLPPSLPHRASISLPVRG